MLTGELIEEIRRGPSGPEIGAFFDVDGTLLAGRSASVFAQEQLRRRQLRPAHLAKTLRVGVEMGLGRSSFDELLAVGAEAWRGRSLDELDDMGERLFVKKLAALVYPETRALVEAHQRQSHTVVLASSATSFQVEPLARDLGIDHVLCSRLEISDGRLTGRVLEPSMWGEGKADAVRKLAANEGIDLQRSYAYADGREDVALLDAVGNPRPTNPDGHLAKVAEQRGWPVRRFTSRGRPRPDVVLRYAAGVGGFFAGTAAGAGVWLLHRDRREAVNVSLSLGSDLFSAIAGIKVRVVGEEHLWSHRPAVFIANHQSSIDVAIILKHLRRDITGVGKKEVARNPALALLGRVAGAAFVDRSNTTSAVAALGPLVEQLKDEGRSILVFPEGTRSPTPRLGPFRKGAFRVAMAGNIPIVPIVIVNAHALQPGKTALARPGTVDVVVLPPISVADWTLDDLDDRIAEVRHLFVETMATC